VNVAGRHRLLLEHEGAIDGRHPRAAMMPPVSWGNCRVHRCGVVGDLAAKLCQYHWDMGLDKYDKDEESAVE
jgi:hypothetical protein